MMTIRSLLFLAVLPWVAACEAAPPPELPFEQRPVSRLVYPGADGRLVYRPDARGNRMPDFSHAGYGGGGVALPRAAVKAVVEAGPGDDGDRIQAALDRVSRMAPDRNGLRGAVLLKRGTYEFQAGLKIRTSGVVLRGEGQGPDGTILKVRGKIRSRAIVVAPAGKRGRPKLATKFKTMIEGRYVPLRARQFRVDGKIGFVVGDTVAVIRPSTAKWISALGMDRIPPRRNGGEIVQWAPGKFDIRYYRTVTAIDGDQVTIDAPLFHDLDPAYTTAYVVKADFGGYLRQVGAENMRAISVSDGHPEDAGGNEDHPWDLVYMNGVQDGWVRDVTALQFSHAAVRTSRYTRRITVQDSRYLRPISRITGTRRYAFDLQGQLHLGIRLFAEYGRHDFVTGRQWSSGIVFLDSLSRYAYAPSEPHHRYSTGILYDNVRFEKPYTDLVLSLWNRLNFGTGHGWAAANSVLWNCAAPEGGVGAEKPPLAQNYAIGIHSARMSGELDHNSRILTASFRPGQAHWEYWNAGPVRPRSLYLAQLEDRLSKAARAEIEAGQALR